MSSNYEDDLYDPTEDELEAEERRKRRQVEYGQPVLQDGHAALAVRTERGNAVVDRQRAEHRQEHQHQRGERRQVPGREERDAGLIAERREVIDAREAHDLPPGRRVTRPQDGRLAQVRKEPPAERRERCAALGQRGLGRSARYRFGIVQ